MKSLIAISLALMAAQQTFRSGVDLVTMNVAVRRNGAMVTGLTARDFRLTDNGIEQRVEVSVADAVPADISLLIDTSGSMDGTMDDMRAQVRAVAKLLRPDDRLRLLTFAGDVREVFGFRASTDALPLDTLVAGGWTAMHDALSLAFIHQPAPDRSHLIVVFSDAEDSASTVDQPRLAELTRRTDAVLQLFVVAPRRPPASRRAPASRERAPMPPIAEIASLTGGDATLMAANDDVSDGFRKALSEFRRRYVLRYTTDGGRQTGWHEVHVAVTLRGDFEVRTRRGYVQ
jgi:VWFA-related protein